MIAQEVSVHFDWEETNELGNGNWDAHEDAYTVEKLGLLLHPL